LKLAELRAQRDALISAIEPLDRLLTADPTHETAVRRLMVLLTQLDRRGEAIRVYERLATILRRDYENDPLPETVELYKTLRQRQSQAAPSSHIPLPETSQIRSETDAQETVKNLSSELDGENNHEIVLDQQTM
jgi:DNA-binding SARP family transcriptional activator